MIVIGSVIGFVMGLTGAGGALVAIPLFMHFLNMSLKEASVYSLLAVVMASLSNFYYQRKHAQIPLAATFVVASGLGSFLSYPYKKLLPDLGIAIILTMVALYSLYNVWAPVHKAESSGRREHNYLQTIFLGLLLGVLTTYTGLGGGVLMLPILLGIYKLNQKQAVATSLVVVGLSSLISFLIQIFKGSSIHLGSDFLVLLLIILATSYVFKIFIAKTPPRVETLLRRLVFTVVVAIAVAKIFQL